MVLGKYGFEMDSSPQKNPWRNGVQYVCMKVLAIPAAAISRRLKAVERRFRARSVSIIPSPLHQAILSFSC